MGDLPPIAQKILGKIFGSSLFQDAFKVMIGTFVVELASRLSNLILGSNAGKAIGQLSVKPTDFECVVSTMLSRNDLSQEAGSRLLQLHSDIVACTAVADPILTAVYLSKYIGAITDIVSGQVYQEYNKLFSPNAPSIDTVLPAYRFVDISHSPIDDIAARNGISAQDLISVKLAARTPIDPVFTIQLYKSGKIGVEQANIFLQNTGLSPDDASLVLQSSLPNPVTGELVPLLSSIVMDESVAAALGVDEGQPADLDAWNRANGLDDIWARYLWRGHYSMPPMDLAFSAYNQGLISETDLNTYFKAIGMPPALFDVLRSITKVPLTLFQAQQAVQENLIDDAKFLAVAAANGYGSEDASILLGIAKTTVHSDITSTTIRAIQLAIADGFISDDEALAMYEAIGYTVKEAELQVQLAHYQEKYDYVKSVINSIRSSYMKRFTDANTVVQELMSLGVSAQKAQGYINAWSIEKNAARLIPTPAQIEGMMKNGIITDQEAADYLVKLGYSQTDANNIVRLMRATIGGK